MSAKISNRMVEEVMEAATKSVWVQWRSLGSRVIVRGRARWIVDPEALVLVSLALRSHERRLWDVLVSWAKTGSGALSVQRIKNLRAQYPKRVSDRLAEFALIAYEEGGDHRWRTLAGAERGPRARGKTLRVPSRGGWDPAALMVQLRSGFGMGLQADMLTFLLSLHGAWASSRSIADATDYTVYAIRRTADRMAKAQFIESTADKPLKYRGNLKAWRGILGLTEDVPPWRFWNQIYALVAELLDRAENDGLEAPSMYILSSRLRDLYEKHERALRLNNIIYTEPRQYKGEQFMQAFGEIAKNLTNWLAEGT